jgi:hypothetical protein
LSHQDAESDQHEAANKASRTPDKSAYKADDAKED